MDRAQAETYGDGLDERFRHRSMWTWTPHYYTPELAFCNCPYAFGLLLGTGLYAIFRERGAAFVPEYIGLLASPGEAPSAELAARFGIDIRSRGFWDASLAVFGAQIDRYCAL
jgi:oligoendopeptidase F